VKAEVTYIKPDRFKAVVKEPKTHQGITIFYNKGELVSYYPMLRWGIIFRNLKIQTKKDHDSLVEMAYKYNMGLFDYRFGKASSVASYPVINIKHKAKKNAFNFKGETSVYDKYSFPLAGKLGFLSGAKYEYHYETIVFNKIIDKMETEVKVPKNIFTSTWDLSDAGLSNEEIKNRSGLMPPGDLAGSLGLKKIKTIQVTEGFPTFASIYENGPHFLFISFFKDFAGAYKSYDYGIPLTVDKKTGYLIVTPVISSYTFRVGNIVYVMIGNIPFEEILTLSKQI